MKVVTIVGARPQFIKAAVISREIAKHQGIREVIVHTGQHFDENMSDIFFEEMQIPTPHYHLDINSMSHGAMTGRMLEKIEEVLLLERPDFVMVYGDTNSTLAGALAAKKLHIKVIHIEAGLRSFNMSMPEEINRILTDRISDILCCPTEQAAKNLNDEGYSNLPSKVVMTGDVMQDAAIFYRERAGSDKSIVSRLGLEGKKFVLCTVHRAENTDNLDRLRGIIGALNEISDEIEIVFPVHPRTQKIIAENKLALSCKTIDPVGYLDMVNLLTHAKIVLTDSGGLQKEAFFFAKPCVTLRDETEWVELIEGNFNSLAGANQERIVSLFKTMCQAKPDFTKDLYGAGTAAKRIVALLEQYA
ncbi:MAG: UDP-N-acetylglucosamine 2-epimerase (non-hydrolyzing) [Gallionella sp.]